MANWILNGDISTAPSVVVAPNRSSTTQDVTRGAALGYLSLVDVATARQFTPYTASVYVKSIDNQFACMRVGSTLMSNHAEACFDLQNGTTTRVNVVGNVTMTDSYIHNIGDGWYVIGITLTFVDPATIDIFVTPTSAIEDSITTPATTQLSMSVWNPVLERRDNIEESYLGATQTISVPENSFVVVPIFQPNTTSVQYVNRVGSTITINYDPSADFDTGNAVNYLSIPQQSSHGFPDSFVINDNKGGSTTVNINREEQFNRYSPAKVTFLNKRGTLETLWMIRKRVFKQETRYDTYYRNVINYRDFSYDPLAHVNQRFNVVSKEMITLNSAIFPETQNTVIRELLQSENVWVTVDDTTFPVVLMSNNVDYLTHNNDKLVQYTFDFEYAHRLDNTIR